MQAAIVSTALRTWCGSLRFWYTCPLEPGTYPPFIFEETAFSFILLIPATSSDLVTCRLAEQTGRTHKQNDDQKHEGKCI